MRNVSADGPDDVVMLFAVKSAKSIGIERFGMNKKLQDPIMFGFVSLFGIVVAGLKNLIESMFLIPH